MKATKFNKRAGKRTPVWRIRGLGKYAGFTDRYCILTRDISGKLWFKLLPLYEINKLNKRGFTSISAHGLYAESILLDRAGEHELAERIRNQINQDL